MGLTHPRNNTYSHHRPLNMRPTRTVAVTSGKGGVGKSSLVANLALFMGRRGQRVLLLDGDFGMGNLDIMFGMRPSNILVDIMNGKRDLRQSLIKVADNVHLIPGGSGILSLYQTNHFQKQSFMDQINDLEGSFDIMLIDTASGMDENVLYLSSAAQEIIVVVTPEPSSLADAYALIKVLFKEKKENRFCIICNDVRDELESKRVYQLLYDTASKFLCVSLRYLGYVPNDQSLRMATKSQQLISNLNPGAPSSLGLDRLSEKVSCFNMMDTPKGGLQFFWNYLVKCNE